MLAMPNDGTRIRPSPFCERHPLTNLKTCATWLVSAAFEPTPKERPWT